MKRIEVLLQKRQAKAAKKYDYMVKYMNMVHEYDRFTIADTAADIKVIGVGGCGLLLILVGVLLKIFPFMASGMDMIPYSVLGITPSLQMLVNIFVTIGFVVSFMGYKLAYKYQKEHFGASAAVTVYLDVFVPTFSILAIILIASWFFPPIAANLFNGQTIRW